MQEHGNEGLRTFLGMPMRWDLAQAFRNLWNPNDDRLFPPKGFGIGWDVNFHAVAKRLGVLGQRKAD